MKIHWQVNPGGTFPVTACGMRVLRCYAGKNPDVRPTRAFDVSPERLRCAKCAAHRERAETAIRAEAGLL